ncbi:hypothetical protein [Streptomyces purpureus]|uniref:Uncharacterized protein n=1 Tax=Streptomyces purpureus TaxID=1951 RepID=A0A918GYE5_9ACTN|nr:hypothetical protein [Streptomyces purpureus]GGT15291.1 hypothetical protein GCM10014713_05090 [Streptomyces purpureus]
MKPLSRAVRVVVTGRARASADFPGHPETYEINDPDEIRELLAALPEERPEPHHDFICMCQEEPALTLYDAAGQRIRSLDPHLPGLLDPGRTDAIPGRHRAAWAAAAPEPLRGYAGRWARGEDPGPGAVRSVPLRVVLGWLGAPRSRDAAHLLARQAPTALLEAATTDELAWAVRESDAVALDAAVGFFASEGFTARHPKKRRVGPTARDMLLRHARRHRPEHVAVLERRMLTAPEDRIKR